MAKKINNPVQANRPLQRPAAVNKKKEEVYVEQPFVPDPKIPAWLYSFKNQAILVAMLAIGLYCNTFNHEYALDDTILIVKNIQRVLS